MFAFVLHVSCMCFTVLIVIQTAVIPYVQPSPISESQTAWNIEIPTTTGSVRVKNVTWKLTINDPDFNFDFSNGHFGVKTTNGYEKVSSENSPESESFLESGSVSARNDNIGFTEPSRFSTNVSTVHSNLISANDSAIFEPPDLQTVTTNGESSDTTQQLQPSYSSTTNSEPEYSKTSISNDFDVIDRLMLSTEMKSPQSPFLISSEFPSLDVLPETAFQESGDGNSEIEEAILFLNDAAQHVHELNLDPEMDDLELSTGTSSKNMDVATGFQDISTEPLSKIHTSPESLETSTLTTIQENVTTFDTGIENQMLNESTVSGELDFVSISSHGNESSIGTDLADTKKVSPAPLALNLTAFTVEDSIASEITPTASNTQRPACPPPGVCLLWFMRQDTCEVDGHCLGSRICCKVRCSKTCIDT